MVLRVLNASLDNLRCELRLAHPAQAGQVDVDYRPKQAFRVEVQEFNDDRNIYACEQERYR